MEKPDFYSLANAGLSKEEINKISECEDRETNTNAAKIPGSVIGRNTWKAAIP